MLFGLPAIDNHRIQMIQNITARLVTRTPRQQSITSTLKKLHWLPVDNHIIFQLLLITFKAQHSSSPSYLTDLLKQYHPPQTLRSSNQAFVYKKPILYSIGADLLQLLDQTFGTIFSNSYDRHLLLQRSNP